MRGKLLIRPAIAIGPVPGSADRLIEATIVRRVDRIESENANGRIVEASRP